MSKREGVALLSTYWDAQKLADALQVPLQMQCQVSNGDEISRSFLLHAQCSHLDVADVGVVDGQGISQ